jgi:putative transcriptional regulator
MSKLGKRLIKAAREARSIARGEVDSGSHRVFVPADVDVRAIRNALKLSQAQFAMRFGLRARTVQDWEQHRREPEGPALVLLQVIKKEPDAVFRALESV